MMKRELICLMISLLILSGCSGKYEIGDYYKNGDTKGIVIKNESDVLMVMSIDEAVNIDADSAARWASSYDGEGWSLPNKAMMGQIKKYKSVINKTLERKGLPTILTNNTFYWTETACSESHTYACGPDGIQCYFNQNSSPYYRARAVKIMNNK